MSRRELFRQLVDQLLSDARVSADRSERERLLSEARYWSAKADRLESEGEVASASALWVDDLI